VVCIYNAPLALMDQSTAVGFIVTVLARVNAIWA
jgi:hypothetical protein